MYQTVFLPGRKDTTNLITTYRILFFYKNYLGSNRLIQNEI